MEIHFACPVCERPAKAHVPGRPSWQCPGCDHLVALAAPEMPAATGPETNLAACLICGNVELYKKKAFPHWLGLSLLSAACLAFLVLNALRWYLWAWVSLLGSALIDLVLYLFVGDAIVCYRCGAHHSCAKAAVAHKPYELIIAERYRQEKLRHIQIHADKKLRS